MDRAIIQREAFYMKNNEYLSALEYFIDKMLVMKNTINIDISEQIGRLCNVLRISRITVTLYDNYRTVMKEGNATAVIYDCPPLLPILQRCTLHGSVPEKTNGTR